VALIEGEMMQQVKVGRQHKVDPTALTDDMAYDDIVGASEGLKAAIQLAVGTYNLTGSQLLAALHLALKEIVPDERLYAAIDGELTGKPERAVAGEGIGRI
jgi:hypothetical protein